MTIRDRKLTVAVLLSSLLFSLCNFSEENVWMDQVLRFYEKHFNAQLSDVCKVLYQVTFGPGHLGNDSIRIATEIPLKLSDKL